MKLRKMWTICNENGLRDHFGKMLLDDSYEEAKKRAYEIYQPEPVYVLTEEELKEVCLKCWSSDVIPFDDVWLNIKGQETE